MQGDELVINPVDWNADLNVGGDTTLGFCADGYNNIQLNSASITP
jgi:cellulase/cellobiase CelA1